MLETRATTETATEEAYQLMISVADQKRPVPPEYHPATTLHVKYSEESCEQKLLGVVRNLVSTPHDEALTFFDDLNCLVQLM